MSNLKYFSKLKLVLPVCLLLTLSLIAGCGDDSPTTTNNDNQQTWDPEAGWIGIYADQNGTDCSLQDSGPGTVSYYVMHMGTQSIAASEFMLSSTNFKGVYLGKSSPFELIIGDDPFVSGVSIAYSQCLSAPIHVLTLNFTTDGTTPPCASLAVSPHPYFKEIRAVDCDLNILNPMGMVSYINNDGSCPCSPTPIITGTWDKIRDTMR